MGAVRGIAGTFSGLAAATMLFATPACAAQDDTTRAIPVSATTSDTATATTAAGSSVANAAVSHSVEISDDAHFEADRWVVDQRGRLAVAVSIGEDTLVPSERVEEVLRTDFAEHGLTNVRFFFEQGGAGDSAVSYHSDIYSSGPYPLGTARDHVEDIARRVRFDQRLASNMN